MHYGIDVVNFGDYADPRNMIRIAQAAEVAGWEGVFVWDHLGFAWGAPSGDPWVILSAVAAETAHIKIGTMVTPLPRRRPYVLANTLATLDLLSGGRVILGAGLGGVPEEYQLFGEPDDPKLRAAKLDEGLEVLGRLLTGENLTFHGEHYHVKGVTLAPLPVQKPRLPIWIGGESRPAMRRAARWDGWVIAGDDEACQMVKSPAWLAEQSTILRGYRIQNAPFDVAITGISAPTDGALSRDYEAAGATWWLESLHGYRGSMEEMLARVMAGPPH